MKITSSYQVEILSNTDMKNTVQIYRRALVFVIDVCNKEWRNISVLGGTKEKDHYVEKLIHPTKNNSNPKYPFDIKGSEFYKFPAYLKRAVIAESIGAVSSYRSNYKNWEDNGKNGKVPTLQMDRHAMPVFYNKNMYKEDAPKNAKYPKGMNPGDNNIRWIKLYQNNDWVWIPVRLRKTDINYINKYWGACEDKSAPTLEKIHNKYYLRFSFTETVILSDTPIAEQIICAVDLGINTDAVCSIMKADGTILARKFIDFTSDKDRMVKNIIYEDDINKAFQTYIKKEFETYKTNMTSSDTTRGAYAVFEKSLEVSQVKALAEKLPKITDDGVKTEALEYEKKHGDLMIKMAARYGNCLISADVEQIEKKAKNMLKEVLQGKTEL